MDTILREKGLKRISSNVKPDAKRRVVLPKNLVREDVTYNIYANNIGQIVLDPQVTIPASELWIFEDKKALFSIDKGMAEASQGKTINRGSFAKYLKDEP